MTIPILQIDSFTDRPFAGNPAGVCLLDQPQSEAWMQNVAAEMNLAETAFIVPQDDGFGLRWFTPTCEVALCGHATLASAHALWEMGILPRDKQARFHTASGLLTVELKSGEMEMDFPAEPASPAQAPEGLLSALGVTPLYVGRNRMDYLVEIADAQTLRRLSPDLATIRKIKARGIIVTAKSDLPKYDFMSRFFAPAAGIDEDPVTGSAHCCLGPYWQDRLGKSELKAYQASRRGGEIGVRVMVGRVLLKGQAVTVLRGQLIA